MTTGEHFNAMIKRARLDMLNEVMDEVIELSSDVMNNGTVGDARMLRKVVERLDELREKEMTPPKDELLEELKRNGVISKDCNDREEAYRQADQGF